MTMLGQDMFSAPERHAPKSLQELERHLRVSQLRGDSFWPAMGHLPKLGPLNPRVAHSIVIGISRLDQVHGMGKKARGVH